MTHMRALRSTLLALALVASPPAVAVQPSEQLADPKLEQRARDLSGHLRCMVCQNQSIDDSDAPLARDLRVLVRERLKAGDSDDAIMKFLSDRYGDFILLKPPFKLSTVLLWLTPVVALLLGILGLHATLRRRNAAEASVAALTDDEKKRIEALLSREPPGA
jgi:cytochrome c-type biogenesis protein CcmH